MLYNRHQNGSVLCIKHPNYSSMLWVALLELFIYSVASFAFLRQFFYPNDNSVLFCDNLFEYFVSVLRY